MFGQTLDARDLLVIGLLIVLEGVLSIDNALVLGLLARRLPKQLQGKALTYGLVGAFVFRLIAIATASVLLRWRVVKLLGGAYLIYVAVKHFFFDASDPDREQVKLGPDGTPVVPEGGDEREREESIAAREPGAVGMLDAAPGEFEKGDARHYVLFSLGVLQISAFYPRAGRHGWEAERI